MFTFSNILHFLSHDTYENVLNHLRFHHARLFAKEIYFTIMLCTFSLQRDYTRFPITHLSVEKRIPKAEIKVLQATDNN